MLSEKAQKNLENLDNYVGTYTTFDEFEECNPTYEPKAEDVIYCTEENKLYIYDMVEGWHAIIIPENEQIDTGISVYDLNKQAIEQLGPAKEGDIRHARGLINKVNKVSPAEYYMLLFKEISYYTIFHNTIEESADYEKLGTAIIDCINDIGTIYQITETENNSFEIWIKTNENEMTIGYLFPYDQGIVTVHKKG